MSYPIGTISDIATVISGYAFKSSWFGFGNDKVIRIGDLQNGVVDLSDAKCIDSSEHSISENYRIKKGDVLMALSGATVGKIAVVDSLSSGALLNQRIAIIRGHNEVNASYLKYLFRGELMQNLLRSAGGAAQPNLSPKKLLTIEIPIPSLDEQRRIADILDKADEIMKKSADSQNLRESMVQSLFMDMFGDPMTNPKGWEKQKLVDVISEIQNGIGKNKQHYGSGEKVANIGDLYPSFSFSPVKYSLLEVTEKEKEKYLLKHGDLLFVRSSLKKEGVAVCSFFDSTEECLFSSFMIKASPRKDIVNPAFLSVQMRTSTYREYLINAANTATITNISQPNLKELRVIVPPIDIQNKFSRILESITNIPTSQDLANDNALSIVQEIFS